MPNGMAKKAARKRAAAGTNTYTITLEVRLTIRADKAHGATVQAMAEARTLDHLQSVRPTGITQHN